LKRKPSKLPVMRMVFDACIYHCSSLIMMCCRFGRLNLSMSEMTRSIPTRIQLVLSIFLQKPRMCLILTTIRHIHTTKVNAMDTGTSLTSRDCIWYTSEYIHPPAGITFPLRGWALRLSLSSLTFWL
jgi:hypothetical protein